MSRSKSKHKQERKRRHKRQIEEGTRKPREKIKKEITTPTIIVKRSIKLSEVDRELVRAVLDAVRKLDSL